MLRSRSSRSSTKSKRQSRDEGVVEPDTRIVFAVMAIGLLVGAMLTTPSKDAAKLKAPEAHTASR